MPKNSNTPFNLNSLRLSRVAFWMIILVIIGFLLVYFDRFLKPLVFAFLLWFIIKELRDILGKLKVKGKSLPFAIRNLISFIIIILFVFFTVDIIRLNIKKLAANIRTYEASVEQLIDSAEQSLDMPTLSDDLDERIQGINYDKVISGMVNSITSFLGDFILIIIYLAFLLLEETVFPMKRKLLVQNLGESGEASQELVKKIGDSVSKYLSVKVLTSFLTGFLSFIVLKIIGIELAMLWAFLIFLLNFIPSIGSLIATLFPALFSIVQYGEFSLFLIIIIAVGSVQLLVGNVIEPRIMGNTLNISPLVIIAGLAFWGIIWGILGMLLSAPITAIGIIIMAQFNETRNIAILLSHKGEIDVFVDANKDEMGVQSLIQNKKFNLKNWLFGGDRS